MSGAVKVRRIEISIRSGARKKLFLVSEEKAHAIEILLKDSPEDVENNLIDIGDVFPDLNNPAKLPAITFRGIRAKTGLTQKELAELLNITQAEVSKIEGGTRAIGKALAKKIGKEFKINYRRFL